MDLTSRTIVRSVAITPTRDLKHSNDFAEWRHAHGMRCLGIPNTAHFANVTQIEDAMALWEKLKQQKQEEAWKPEQEEEYEDSQGNVVNKKIFEDLKRQGLL